MSFPAINIPTFALTIPSTGEEIRIRAFTTKEEKLLLIAQADHDPKELPAVIDQIIKNCVQTPNFDTKGLASFDLEYMFIQMRAASVGDIVTLKFTVPETECKECKDGIEVKVNLRDVKVITEEGHSKKIELTPDVGVVMKYPMKDSLSVASLQNPKDAIEEVFKTVARCIEKIYSSESVYQPLSDDLDKTVKWLESLPPQMFEKITQFFATMPAIRHKVSIDCGKCGYHEEQTLTGLQDFLV